MTALLLHGQTAFFADFVLLLDADEFLSAPDRPALEAMLEAIPPGGVGLMPWRTFVLRPGEAARAAEDPPRLIRWRRAEERPVFRKAVLRLDRAHRPELRVEQGNHGVTAASGEAPPAVDLDGLPLLHVPVRSHGQIVAQGRGGVDGVPGEEPGGAAGRPGLPVARGLRPGRGGVPRSRGG